ncbi:MAG TPA: hypothetical protein VG672_19515, partial [Bryobacteraceae bacterium]|nr:hypothetical protein [Bryobacteraceae bacterium]
MRKVPASRDSVSESEVRVAAEANSGLHTQAQGPRAILNAIHNSPAMLAQRRRIEGIRHSPYVTARQLQIQQTFGNRAQLKRLDSGPPVVQRVRITETTVSPNVYEAYNRLPNIIKSYIAAARDMSAFFRLDADAQVLFLEALQTGLPVLDAVIQQEALPRAIESGSGDATQPRPPSLPQLRGAFFLLNPDFMNQAVHLMTGQSATFSFFTPQGPSALTIASLSALRSPTVALLMAPPEASNPEHQESLTDHLMKMGGLDKLMGERVIPVWQGLARDLADFATGPDRVAADGLMYCGNLRLGLGGEATFVTNPTSMTGELQGRVREFMLAFMRANGELAFLERQPWFGKDEWVVDVEVNFYPNRGLEDVALGLHKDTDSRNLFVHLIFNNLEATPATEWTQDREPPSTPRAKELRRLPQKVNRDLQGARGQLGGIDKPGKERFEGGLAPPNAYVSWVDELVWHSSPMLGHRSRLSKDDVLKEFNTKGTSYATF